jgi:hypothetical protein
MSAYTVCSCSCIHRWGSGESETANGNDVINILSHHLKGAAIVPVHVQYTQSTYVPYRTVYSIGTVY